MLIDIHHHYVPQRFIDLVRADPERWQAVVYRDEQTGLDALVTGRAQPLNWPGPGRLPAALDPGIFDLAVRLEEMDAMGLDMAALSVMPGLFYYFAEPELGAEASQVLNDAIHEACRATVSELGSIDTCRSASWNGWSMHTAARRSRSGPASTGATTTSRSSIRSSVAPLSWTS